MVLIKVVTVFLFNFCAINLSQTILITNERWNDDFLTHFNRGKNGWSIQGDYLGINTSNEYHGFFHKNSDTLYRTFTYKITSTDDVCDISFNIVFGCKPTFNDSVIFKIENDIDSRTFIKTFKYNESYPYTFLNDIRLYWGNNDIKNSIPQCILPNDINEIYTKGGYMIYYNHLYEITNVNKDETFTIKFLPYFNDSNPNKYYGVYNISILCGKPEILYKKSAFISTNILTRHIILWVIGSVFVLLLCIYFIYLIIQQKSNISNKNISINADNLVTKPKHNRNLKSIVYDPRSAADVFRDMKKIKKFNKEDLKIKGFRTISNKNSENYKDDQKNDTNIALNMNGDNYKPIPDKSNTNTPETEKNKNNSDFDIIMPIIKDDDSDNTPGHLKLVTTIVKDIDNNVIIEDE